MFKYYSKGKRYAIQKNLHKIRLILFLLIPIGFLFVRPNIRIYLHGLLILGFLISALDYYSSKKKFFNSQSFLHQWLVIIGTNIYLMGFVFLTGGLKSPFQSILVLPTLFFTLELGPTPGIICLAFLLLFKTVDFFLSPSMSSTQLVTGLYQLFTAGLIFSVIHIHNQVLARYHKKINNLLIYDSLTSLFNRRYLKSIILEWIKINRPFAMIMMDINYFKYYNDYWGHTKGDILLKTFGHFLKLATNKIGPVIRNSGDEFIILIPNPDLEQTIVERIQNMVVDYPFPGEECFPRKKLSICLGVARYPDHGTSFIELFEKADQQLYQNKKFR